MTIVTGTFWRLASASAPATIVLIAARFKYFFEGKSEARSVPIRLNATDIDLNMRGMVSAGVEVSKPEPGGGRKHLPRAAAQAGAPLSRELVKSDR